jgi:hypothetical protein
MLQYNTVGLFWHLLFILHAHLTPRMFSTPANSIFMVVQSLNLVLYY